MMVSDRGHGAAQAFGGWFARPFLNLLSQKSQLVSRSAGRHQKVRPESDNATFSVTYEFCPRLAEDFFASLRDPERGFPSVPHFVV